MRSGGPGDDLNDVRVVIGQAFATALGQHPPRSFGRPRTRHCDVVDRAAAEMVCKIGRRYDEAEFSESLQEKGPSVKAPRLLRPHESEVPVAAPNEIRSRQFSFQHGERRPGLLRVRSLAPRRIDAAAPPRKQTCVPLSTSSSKRSASVTLQKCSPPCSAREQARAEPSSSVGPELVPLHR